MTISSFFFVYQAISPWLFHSPGVWTDGSQSGRDLMANIHRGLDKYTQICNHDDSDNDN